MPPGRADRQHHLHCQPRAAGTPAERHDRRLAGNLLIPSGCRLVLRQRRARRQPGIEQFLTGLIHDDEGAAHHHRSARQAVELGHVAALQLPRGRQRAQQQLGFQELVVHQLVQPARGFPQRRFGADTGGDEHPPGEQRGDREARQQKKRRQPQQPRAHGNFHVITLPTP